VRFCLGWSLYGTLLANHYRNSEWIQNSQRKQNYNILLNIFSDLKYGSIVSDFTYHSQTIHKPFEMNDFILELFNVLLLTVKPNCYYCYIIGQFLAPQPPQQWLMPGQRVTSSYHATSWKWKWNSEVILTFLILTLLWFCNMPVNMVARSRLMIIIKLKKSTQYAYLKHKFRN